MRARRGTYVWKRKRIDYSKSAADRSAEQITKTEHKP